ncbi:hypothetical protein HDU96_005452 [Phlyctochytrium bullatum]|nr:hypothetical protein HDU96_005452 [Phlyctochytrium bullatum]
MLSIDVTVDGDCYRCGPEMEGLLAWENSIKLAWSIDVQHRLAADDPDLALKMNEKLLKKRTRKELKKKGRKVYEEIAEYLRGLGLFVEGQVAANKGLWCDEFLNDLKEIAAELNLPPGKDCKRSSKDQMNEADEGIEATDERAADGDDADGEPAFDGEFDEVDEVEANGEMDEEMVFEGSGFEGRGSDEESSDEHMDADRFEASDEETDLDEFEAYDE